jgi:rhodanese-related sulfurtransferase
MQRKLFIPLVAVGIAIVVIATGSLLLVTSNIPASNPSSSGLPLEISSADALQKKDSGAFILDVRQPEEWAEYHMPGSTLIPLGELAARIKEVPADREIVVICRSGNRSKSGRDILLEAGYSKVTSMAGGLTDWRNRGYPTESGN